MKKTLIALVALSGLAMADATYVATFVNGDAPTWSDINFKFDGQTAEDHTIEFADHSSVTYDHEAGNGRTWQPTASNTWTNTAALADLSSTVGKSITSVSGLGVMYGAGNGSFESLILTLNADAFGGQVIGQDITLYTFIAQGDTGKATDAAAITSFTVNGLADGYTVSYATETGNGFVTTPSFSEGSLHMTLVKVTGVVASTNITVDNNAYKGGYSMLAAKVTPEPATATLSLLALAGLASRRRRH